MLKEYNEIYKRWNKETENTRENMEGESDDQRMFTYFTNVKYDITYNISQTGGFRAKNGRNIVYTDLEGGKLRYVGSPYAINDKNTNKLALEDKNHYLYFVNTVLRDRSNYGSIRYGNVGSIYYSFVDGKIDRDALFFLEDKKYKVVNDTYRTYKAHSQGDFLLNETFRGRKYKVLFKQWLPISALDIESGETIFPEHNLY